eukprot:jgi/Botrbrau1/12339/Bobra.4_3s0011.1
MQICGIFIKFYLLQRVSFGERDWRSRLDSSRRWSVISPSLHGSGTLLVDGPTCTA